MFHHWKGVITPIKSAPKSPQSLDKFHMELETLLDKKMKCEEQSKKAFEKKAGQPKKTIDKLKSQLAQRCACYHGSNVFKNNWQIKCKEYHQKTMIKIKNDPERKKAFNKEKAAARAKSRSYIKWASRHNAKYLSKKDQVPAKLSQKDLQIIFRKTTKSYFLPIKRLKHIGQDIYYKREPIGKLGEGMFRKITQKSMQKAICKAYTILGANKRASCSVSLDLGCGLGNPSTFFSQAYFEEGMHFGIEFDKGLLNVANGNLKRITMKGVANVKGGFFKGDYIITNGELSHVRTPHVALVHGDIQDVEHVNGFDLIYCFDACHTPHTKRAMQKAWDHPLSKNCKLFITNNNKKEVEDVGLC